MSVPDSGAIGNALVAKLGADSALLALCPNGVYWADDAPEGLTRFVTVSLVVSFDDALFGGRAFEEHTFEIEAKMLSGIGTVANLAAAAARIDVVLEDSPLIVSGFTWMETRRRGTERVVERDGVDPKLLWRRRGGQYVVQMALATVGNL